MKLYYVAGACSLSPHIVLREAGLEFAAIKTNTRNKTFGEGQDFLAVNAKGKVPVLELDDGQRLTEGPAIVQYLADLAPASGLAPANGTLERVRLQEWLNFTTSELHKGFVPLFNPATPAEYRQIATASLEKNFDWVNGQLEGRSYLLGEQFTVADAYLYTVANWSSHVGIDLQRWPNLAAYQARVAARPAVQAALRAEGLLK